MRVPELPLKYLVDPARSITYGIVQAGEDVADGVPYIRPVDMTEASGVPDPDALRRTAPEIAATYRRSEVRRGDLVVSIGPSFGKIMVVPEALGGANLTQGTARVAPGRRAYPGFLYWALQSAPVRSQWDAAVGGATFRALNLEPLGLTRVPVPPLEEQRRIADFLDTETARLDHLTSAITRREELLRARREAAIIDVATGRGRSHEDRCATHDPWIPEAPAHWRIGPLKRWWRVIDCKHRTPEYLATGIPVISPGDVSPGRLDLSRAHRFVSETDYSDLADHLRRPRRGDIVYSRNASVGIAAYVDTDARFTMGQDVCRITSAGQSQRYLAYVLNYVVGAELGAAQIGTTFTRINIARLLDVHVPCPPRDVQDDLAQQMDAATTQHQDLMRVSAQHRRLLSERRQALITAAVTGRLDVTTARRGHS